MINNAQINSKKEENYFYPKNFWQNFGVLYNHIKKKEKEFSNLLFIFNKISTIINEYSNSIQDLLNNNFKIPNDCTTTKGINIFLNQLKEESLLYKQLFQDIQDKIINDLNLNCYQSIKNGKNSLKNKFYFTKNFEENLNRVISKKKDYHLSVYQSLRQKLDIEAKKNFLSEQKEEKQIRTEINKLKIYIENAKNARKLYKEQLIECEKNRIEYIKEMENVYKIFEDNDKQMLNSIKKSLFTFNNIKINMNNKILELLQKNLNDIINKINPDEDHINFINNNKGVGAPPLEIKFIEYSSDLPVDLFEIQNLDEKAITQITKQFLNNEFHNEDIKIESKENNKIKNYCIKIWEKKFKTSHLNELLEQFEDKNSKCLNMSNCLFFLNFFNNLRIEGNFTLNDDTFNILCEIFNKIINLCYNEKNDKDNINFDIFGRIMVLSQTYYKLNESDLNQKIYLKDEIQKNPVFKENNFWVGLTKFYINYNFQNQNGDIHNSIVEINETNKYFLNSIIEAKVSTIIFNMNSYNIEKKKIYDIINILCQNYNNLNKKLLEQMLEINMDNNFKEIKKNNEENSIQNNIEQIDFNNNKSIDFENEMKESNNIINDLNKLKQKKINKKNEP